MRSASRKDQLCLRRAPTVKLNRGSRRDSPLFTSWRFLTYLQGYVVRSWNRFNCCDLRVCGVEHLSDQGSVYT